MTNVAAVLLIVVFTIVFCAWCARPKGKRRDNRMSSVTASWKKEGSDPL